MDCTYRIQYILSNLITGIISQVFCGCVWGLGGGGGGGESGFEFNVFVNIMCIID